MDFAFHTFISVRVCTHGCEEPFATGASGEMLLSPSEWHVAGFC